MSQQKTVKVWDLGIRVFHWSLVTMFAIAYVSGEDFENIHAWSGYVIAFLLLFRLVWGFTGTQYARFSNFIYPPAKVIQYLKSLKTTSPDHYFGHNPAGGWMVILLLIFLLVTTWTGLEAYAEEGHGPLAQTSVTLLSNAYADNDEDENRLSGNHKKEESIWEELHELFANLTLALVFIHIAGVVVSSRLHKENLVKAMVKGTKELP